MADGSKKVLEKKNIFLIIGVAILLIALPLIIFRPAKLQETSHKKQERFTFMTNTPRTTDDRHDLEYWEKTGNPQLFAKPDSEFGYSAFLNPEMNHLRPVDTNVEHLPMLPGAFSPAEISVYGERSASELLANARFPLIETSQKYQTLFVKAPAFLLEGGIVLPMEGFQQPSSKVQFLKSTVIRIKKEKKDLPPVLTVEQSCGDEQLDNAALRALHFPAVVNDKVTGLVRVEWLNGVDK